MSSSTGRSDEQRVEHPKLDELKGLLKIYFLRIKCHRRYFIGVFGALVRDWKERLPNLRDIFTRQEMDWILESEYLSQEIVDFVIRSGYKDEPKVDEDGKPLLHRTTPIHYAHRYWSVRHMIPDLFKIYDRFDVNYVDEDGYSHFHVACEYGLDDVAEKFLDHGQDPNCIVPKTSDSLIHFALKKRNKKIVELLLRRGADQNLRNGHGSTPLHVTIDTQSNLSEMLFKFCDEKRLPVEIDARDNWGNTPLHLALWPCNSSTLLVELLLRRGADPTLANDKGETPLHIICQSARTGFSLELFFELNDELQHTLQIDARDNKDSTPLHLATSRRNALGYSAQQRIVFEHNAQMIELLLRRGADPNSVNAEGLTPLHNVAKHGRGVERFFRAIEDAQRTVQIDTRDNSGRAALEWAVTSCWPPAVVTLLDRGADVSGLVFPTATDSDEYGKINRSRVFARARHGQDYTVFKLAVATGLLAIVELLEKRGYEQDIGDALKVMGFFDKYGLYESTDFSTTKAVDDLVNSIFEEIAKKSTYENYFKFVSSYTFRELHRESMKTCALRLCEKASAKFFRDWALDPFMELIHYQMPVECCEMILENLTNKDLYNICLAAQRQTDEQDKINVIKNVLERNNESPGRDGKAPKRLKIEY